MICDALSQKISQRQFLWIDTNPSLQCFHRRMLGVLHQEFPLQYWEYSQTADEPGSLTVALELLHEFIQTSDQPLHLIGHGLGGALALSYARHYPNRVASVVLLSVAVQPIITWQIYYYQQLAMISCPRKTVLQLVAAKISGINCPRYIQHLADRLDQDLLEAPVNISLLQTPTPLPVGKIPQPLMVCGAVDDPVLKGDVFSDWSHYLKPTDRIHHQPQGGHFFHHQYADVVGMKVRDFWRQFTPQMLQCVLPNLLG
jgi:pimeloyl-ACP methyl ester carboxylesterase